MLGNHPFEDVISNNIIVVSDSILSSNILIYIYICTIEIYRISYIIICPSWDCPLMLTFRGALHLTESGALLVWRGSRCVGALASCSCGSLATWSLEAAPWGHPGAAEFTMELRDVGISWVMFLRTGLAKSVGELRFMIILWQIYLSRYVGMAPNWGENLGQTYIFAFLCILISSNQHGGQKTWALP